MEPTRLTEGSGPGDRMLRVDPRRTPGGRGQSLPPARRRFRPDASRAQRPPSALRLRLAEALSEWPTLAALVMSYGLWLGALGLYAALENPVAGVLCLILIGGYAGALHSSLQHEALHGHPTRSASVNEALIWPALTVLFPYRRFKQLHLRHHCDERLTDPYDDPETWYLADREERALSPAMRAALQVNRTLAGRLILGPVLSAAGLYRADWRRRKERGGARVVGAYLRHAPAALFVLAVAWAGFGVDPLTYLLAVCWPATALLMLRTFAEHRAAEAVGERSAVVEAEGLFSLLFLNNNLHAVHHSYPRLPWYELPAIWRREREAVLEGNGGYVMRGYREIARRWLLSPKEPIAHPLLRRDGVTPEIVPEIEIDCRSDADRDAALAGDPASAGGAADVRLAGAALGDGSALGRPEARPDPALDRRSA